MADSTEEGKEIGVVFDYFAKIGVAAVNLSRNLKVGDKIKIKGMTTNFEQIVDSMQIERKEIEKAKASDEIGIKVNNKVRRHDKIFLI